MIFVLTGDDEYRIALKIQEILQQVPEESCNAAVSHLTYNTPDDLDAALKNTRQISLFSIASITILEGCNMAKWGEAEFNLLADSVLTNVPEASILILVTTGLDRRTKIWKQLDKYCELHEFIKVAPWNEDGLLELAKAALKHHQLSLPPNTVKAFSQAAGNDTARLYQAAAVLRVYELGGNRIAPAAIDAFVPCETQSSLQLADALRQGQSVKALQLLEDLQERGLVLPVVWATLITQFQLWAKVRLAQYEKVREPDLVRLLELKNSGRLYYLKQEVYGLRPSMLVKVLTLLLETDTALKRGLHPDLQQTILSVCRLLKPVPAL